MKQADNKYEPLELLKKLTEEIKTVIFSAIENDKIISQPATTMAVEKDGTIWLYASKETLLKCTSATLIYARPDKNTYLCVEGKAEIINDIRNVNGDGHPAMNLIQGQEDKLMLIKITAAEAAYWDSLSSKMVVFLPSDGKIVSDRDKDYSLAI